MDKGFLTSLPAFLEVILGAGLLSGAIWAIIRLARMTIDFIRGDRSEIFERLTSVETEVKLMKEHLHSLDIETAGHNISDLKERISKLEEKIDKLTSLLIEQQMVMRRDRMGKSDDSH